MARKMKFRSLAISVATYCLIGFVLILFAFPFLWLISTSLKTRLDAFAVPPKLLFAPTMQNYYDAIFYYNVFRNALNSVIVAVFSTLLSLVIGVPAAYAFARFNFRGRRDLGFYVLSTRMAPGISVIVPLYLLFMQLRLLDTHVALIITYLIFNLAFVVWIMKGFFREIPTDVEEAAMIDGCTRLQAFSAITLPLAAPGLAATAIFCLITCWNEFFFALILTGMRSQTLPVSITGFISHQGIHWGQMAAAAILISIPVLVFAMLIQKHLVRAMTFGIVSR